MKIKKFFLFHYFLIFTSTLLKRPPERRISDFLILPQQLVVLFSLYSVLFSEQKASLCNLVSGFGHVRKRHFLCNILVKEDRSIGEAHELEVPVLT